jgi:peptide chain release factor 2
MRRLTFLRGQTEVWNGLQTRLEDLSDLLELAREEGEEAVAGDIELEAGEVEATLGRLEFDLMLSGPYDTHDAILAIHAREGGIDAQDWVAYLMRMYLRWAQRRGWDAEVVSSLEGEEAGFKSVTIELRGEQVYGYAKAEAGQHRLVRLSPFDQAHRRHTSFALVEVMPEAEETSDLEISEEDVKMDTYRASSAGGQHVNKTSSAVRLTHLPTGIVVTCQNERSQLQNRETAMKVLRARLLELELQRQAEEQARLKGEHVSTGWGAQIRSYFLHPYNLVKDHRTGHETSDTEGVLDGDLDEFVHAYLRSTIADSAAAATSGG